MGRLIPIFRGYGIHVEFRHQEDGSYCKLRRLDSCQKEPEATVVQPKAPDDSAEEPSGQSSGVSVKKGKDLQTADGTDGEIRYDAPNAKADLTVPQPAEGDEAKSTPIESAVSEAEEGGAQ